MEEDDRRDRTDHVAGREELTCVVELEAEEQWNAGLTPEQARYAAQSRQRNPRARGGARDVVDFRRRIWQTCGMPPGCSLIRRLVLRETLEMVVAGMAVGVASAGAPLRRAVRIDPMVALRYE